MDRTTKVFECICYDSNHLMVATRWFDEDDEWDELSLEIQAHYERGFWGRIWQGMKYVWNPEDGCFWSGTVLSQDSARKLMLELGYYVDGVHPK